MKYQYLLFVSLLSLFFAGGFSSCKKFNSLSAKNLTFSKDTILFDTVFTTIGSTTQQFKFYNNDNKRLNIEQIELMGGTSSPFRINIDGVSGTYFTNTEMEPKDSLFAFVEVTLEVNNALNPLVIEDSIRFRTNGVDQYVHLVVWGQDAYFHYRDVTQNDTTWANDKPHVIYGYSAVDSSHTLTIPAGTNIHLHKNALLFVYKGALHIEGTYGNEVCLQGDRLEPSYSEVTGQFYGIYMQEALPSKINYCTIKNGTAGIHLFSANASNPSYTLELSNTTIVNCSRYGLFLFTEKLMPNARVKGENCAISRNLFHALFVLGGGDFNLNHCNLLGYASGSQNPAVGISNYYTNSTDGNTYISNIDEGTITNSVIYGSQEQEIAFDTINPNGAANLSFTFDYNLIRSETIPTDNFFNNIIWNQNPLFESITEGMNFDFYSTSPLNGGANPVYANTIPEAMGIGMNNVPRDLSTPDLGAIEIP